MAMDSGSAAWADGPQPPSGRCLVSVELGMNLGVELAVTQRDMPTASVADRPAPALSLAVRTPGRQAVLSAAPGAALPGEHRVLDEHFVVDADTHEAPKWRQLADVLYGSRSRSAGDASRWLLAVTAAHDTCRIAAVPLVRDGGWAVLDTTDRQITFVPVTTSLRPWLLPSCLLGWLTAGGTLQELAAARLDCFPAESDAPRPGEG
ncbi:hypothetical protein ABZX65_24135 [Streptomyces sp. NPDC003300]|uniref:hypothetical protein n=1 Tax=unclassified Streptomyces TaxID=2593676 RepID=UPI0033BC8138